MISNLLKNKSIVVTVLIATFSAYVVYANSDHEDSQETYTLSTFSEVPDELIGCGCSYATTEEDFDNRNLIYADDIGELGMIVVNNKPRMVDLTENSKSPFFIEVTVDSVLARGYESEKIKGQMIVKYEGREIFNSEVIGICGC